MLGWCPVGCGPKPACLHVPEFEDPSRTLALRSGDVITIDDEEGAQRDPGGALVAVEEELRLGDAVGGDRSLQCKVRLSVPGMP